MDMDDHQNKNLIFTRKLIFPINTEKKHLDHGKQT